MILQLAKQRKPLSLRRLSPGVYVHCHVPGMWLLIARIGRRWHLAFIYLTNTPPLWVCEMKARNAAKNSDGYASRALAVAAAEWILKGSPGATWERIPE